MANVLELLIFNTHLSTLLVFIVSFLLPHYSDTYNNSLLNNQRME